MAKIYYFPKKENSMGRWITMKFSWDGMVGIHCLLHPQELDGVGPVDNRPSPDKLHHFVKKFF